ncbi:carboxylesterase type B [Sphingomonas sp. UYP23]
MTGPGVDRRSALFASVAAGAGPAFPLAAMPASAAGTAARGTGSCTTPTSAVARTQYGPVRGYVADHVFTFKGVPYGDDTGGENRWLPAKSPKRWSEPRNTLAYGANCPQTLHPFRAAEHTFLQQWTDGFLGEDMLKLNIWTPSLSGKRPVMVYFHGGGFSFGSSYELASHDGAQMARNHDVVQVSINHRLNVLGFLDLAELGGAPYAESVNVSMTDCVAALRWVQENIANFGGDPATIMIYGQSGGGSKVTTLLGMPGAKGMIQRAAVQSGGGGALPTAEQSRDFSRRLRRELGVTDIAALQKADWNTLFTTGSKVAAEINGPGSPMGGPSTTARVGWGPTDPVRCQTMVFDSTCRMVDDPEGAARADPARLSAASTHGGTGDDETSVGKGLGCARAGTGDARGCTGRADGLDCRPGRAGCDCARDRRRRGVERARGVVPPIWRRNDAQRQRGDADAVPARSRQGDRRGGDRRAGWRFPDAVDGE